MTPSTPSHPLTGNRPKRTMPADLDLHIRDAGAWDTAEIVDVLTAAIAATSLARWVLPTPQARTGQLRARLTGIVTKQIAADGVRVADDAGHITGALVWTTCAATDGPACPDPTAALLDADGDAQRSRLLQAQLPHRHPSRPHHHLLGIGVRPGRQRQGIGTALLADWHHELSAEPGEVLLLAPNTLFGLARDAGYRTLGVPIIPMVSAPPLYVLWRPRATGDIFDSAHVPVTAGPSGRGQWAAPPAVASPVSRAEWAGHR
jgi:ribosomal protein S18 acetylase RimI-like enzyme